MKPLMSHTKSKCYLLCDIYDVQIKEQFIEVCNVDSTTGQELENTVFSLLQKNGLDLNNMYGQGYCII